MGLEGASGEAAGQKMPPMASGRGALRWGAAGAEAGFRASSAVTIRAVLWPDSPLSFGGALLKSLPLEGAS